VARFPYLQDPVRNEHFDVSTIPSKYPATVTAGPAAASTPEVRS